MLRDSAFATSEKSIFQSGNPISVDTPAPINRDTWSALSLRAKSSINSETVILIIASSCIDNKELSCIRSSIMD